LRMIVTDGVVAVFLRPGYWETGILWMYFNERKPGEKDLPVFFHSTNCDYDPVAGCYKFGLAALHDPTLIEDVYIPREYVVGIAVRKEPVSKNQMRSIGFAHPTARRRRK